ncbi:MAG: GNAT family N-acetyltransferase [Acidobacteriota bacterium]|nr:GNAT family N-acetyltransferase [Acidobacteriota bacterium]
MRSLEYTVQQVPVERIRALRKAVLRPYLPADDPYVMPDDHLPATVAFGAVTAADEIVAVARITPEPPPFDASLERSWRLRGMATSPEARNMGVGSAVLAGLVAHISGLGGGILWCNARVAASGLYERGGLRPWGEVWEEPHIGSHIVMWRKIP